MKVAIIDPSCFTMPYDHALCEALVEQGCSVTFIGSRYLYGTWNCRAKYARMNLFYNLTNLLYANKTTGFLRKEFKGIEHVSNMCNLVKYLKKMKPTIIHFQWIPFPLADNPFLQSLQNIAPTVLTIHDVYPYHAAPSSKLQTIYFKSALKQFTHLVVHTQSSYSIVNADFGILNEKISIIPHGIFEQYMKVQNLELDLQIRNLVVVYFGTIKPYKGLDILIGAFAKLPKHVQEETTLLIAGNPKMDVNPLKTLADDLEVAKHIQWKLGYISDEEAGNILRRASVFVLPHKHFEAQSGALMAMLPFGKPIIATTVGGFPDILNDGVHGYLVEPNNIDALTRAMVTILTAPAQRVKMGLAVRQLTRRDLSWNSVARKTIRLYESLLR
jgi:glycosyltransferase involved in cell wall biosynthesis